MEGVTSKDNKVLIFSKDEADISRLDNLLWTYAQLAFLPHSTYRDEFKEGIVYLTNDITDNPINANIIVVRDPSQEIKDTNFEKIFYFFPPQSQVQISTLSKKLTLEGMSCYLIIKSTAGRWNKELLA